MAWSDAARAAAAEARRLHAKAGKDPRNKISDSSYGTMNWKSDNAKSGSHFRTELAYNIKAFRRSGQKSYMRTQGWQNINTAVRVTKMRNLLKGLT